MSSSAKKWAFLVMYVVGVHDVVNFPHFHLIQNHWANFNLTWHKASFFYKREIIWNKWKFVDIFQASSQKPFDQISWNCVEASSGKVGLSKSWSRRVGWATIVIYKNLQKCSSLKTFGKIINNLCGWILRWCKFKFVQIMILGGRLEPQYGCV